jgi:hypothetical protein
MVLVHIYCNSTGGLYYVPREVQHEALNNMGREKYMVLPKQGTNPRGIEISDAAMTELIQNNETRVIKIDWIRKEISYNPFKRWVELWGTDT